MFLDVETKTVDVNSWNALIFIVTTLITILLGAIAWYQRKNSNDQHELVLQVSKMATDIAVMRENGKDMKDDLEEIKQDVAYIKQDVKDHEKRITRLEVHR